MRVHKGGYICKRAYVRGYERGATCSIVLTYNERADKRAHIYEGT